MQQTLIPQRLEIHAELFQTREQQAQLLVKNENSSLFAACNGRHHKLKREGALACASGTEDQRARSSFEPTAQKQVHPGNTAGKLIANITRPVFGGDEARKHDDTAGLD